MKQFTLRKAVSEELDRLIDIDDEASTLYEAAGIKIALDYDHPFVVAESQRWADAINKGLVYLALDANNTPVGFVAFCMVDNQPYLDQLSVHPNNMRQGVGTKLLNVAISWSDDKSLWLTTYSNVAWNRPYYEKQGFITISEESCGPELREIIRQQRDALPNPDERIIMVRHA